MYVYKCPKCPAKVSLGVEVNPTCEACLYSMARMPDGSQAILAVDNVPTIGPMRVETLRAAGILAPETKDALEWLYRNRASNGMAEAFLNVGGRRCIDLVAFARLMREKRA